MSGDAQHWLPLTLRALDRLVLPEAVEHLHHQASFYDPLTARRAAFQYGRIRAAAST